MQPNVKPAEICCYYAKRFEVVKDVNRVRTCTTANTTSDCPAIDQSSLSLLDQPLDIYFAFKLAHSCSRRARKSLALHVIPLRIRCRVFCHFGFSACFSLFISLTFCWLLSDRVPDVTVVRMCLLSQWYESMKSLKQRF